MPNNNKAVFHASLDNIYNIIISSCSIFMLNNLQQDIRKIYIITTYYQNNTYLFNSPNFFQYIKFYIVINQMKQVLILICLTIPASGKTTNFIQLKQKAKLFNVTIISSDNIRHEKMLNLMEKHEGLAKKEAYYQTKDIANIQYYQQLKKQLVTIQNLKQNNKYVIVMDKNYSKLTLQPALNQIKNIAKQFQNISIKIVGVLPKCNKQLAINQQICFPFSFYFVACCLKRVISRENHPTLEGSKEIRASTCIGWASNFKNFLCTPQDLLSNKYFDGIIYLPFTKQQQIPKQINQIISQILIETQPGTFDEHPLMKKLIQYITFWKYQQLKAAQNVGQIQQAIYSKFQNFNKDQKQNNFQSKNMLEGG